MEYKIVLETIKSAFEMEISNNINIEKNSVVVYFADGKNCQITIKNAD